MTREAIARHSSVGTRQYATSTADRPFLRVAARGAAFALVPGDKDPATLLVGGGIENQWHVGGQPGVAVGDGAIVHVVGEIRRDEVVAGDRVVSQVGGQFREGSDVCDAVRRSGTRSEEHTSELQSRLHLVCRLLLE